VRKKKCSGGEASTGTGMMDGVGRGEGGGGSWYLNQRMKCGLFGVCFLVYAIGSAQH